MKRSATTWPLAILLMIVLFLPAGYMGAYYTMLDDYASRFESVLVALGGRKLPEYRVKSEFAANIFWPAHQIDRKIRPEHWGD